MRLNDKKTSYNENVICSSLKSGKVSWLKIKQNERDIQRTIFIIYLHSLDFPNAGVIRTALQKTLQRIEKDDKEGRKWQRLNLKSLISIVADIAYKNPNTYCLCAAIISHFLKIFNKQDKREIIEKIHNKFYNKPNIGYMLVWLQRISLTFDYKYKENLCKIVNNSQKNSEKEDVILWNNEWTNSEDLKNIICSKNIIDLEELQKTSETISSKEIEIFSSEFYNNGS